MIRTPASVPGRWGRAWPLLLAALAVVMLAEGCLLGLRSASLVEINYNEGWNAQWADTVTAGRNPYVMPSPYIGNNYPPLSFYLVSLASKITDSSLMAGRLLCWLSILSIAAMAAAMVDRGSYRARLLAALCFPILLFGQSRRYAGVNDPQLLGLAFSVLALFLAVRRPAGRASLPLAAAAAALAIAVKHNLVSVPISICLGLFLARPLAGLAWGAGFALLLGLEFLAASRLLGPAFDEQIYGNMIRVMNWSLVRRAVSWFAIHVLPLTVPAMPLAARGLRRDRGDIVAICAVVSLGLGLYFSKAEGVALNVFFDFFVCLSVLLGSTAGRLEEVLEGRRMLPLPGRLARLGQPVAALAVLTLVVVLLGRASNPLPILRDCNPGNLARQQAQFLDGVSIAREARAPVICESQLTAWMAGKTITYEAFGASQFIMHGIRSEDELVSLVAEKHFGLIQLRSELKPRYYNGEPLPPLKTDDRFTLRTLQAVAANYVLKKKIGEWAFYVPAG